MSVNGAVPTSIIDDEGSAVALQKLLKRHIEEDAAALKELRGDISELKTTKIQIRTIVGVMAVLVSVGIALVPWMTKRAVESVLIEHGFFHR